MGARGITGSRWRGGPATPNAAVIAKELKWPDVARGTGSPGTASIISLGSGMAKGTRLARLAASSLVSNGGASVKSRTISTTSSVMMSR